MKSPKLMKSILAGSLVLGTLGLMAPSLSLADGKGASKLISPAPAIQVSAPKATHMACCADRYVQVVDTSAKGMNAGATKAVATHPCPSCQTKIVSTGAGKAKTDTVVHTCGNSASTSSSCCVATK